MKKLILFFLIFISLNSFGQQIQWTTNENGLFQNSEIKVIPKDKVLDKLLEYHETYMYYYDNTGYTKSGFFHQFENSNFYTLTVNKNWEEFRKSISNINDLTITCIKNNSGKGPFILILIVNKDNIDVISFSDGILLSGGNPTSTFNGKEPEKKMRFIKFYNSLIE
jgi:hypothetical protein